MTFEQAERKLARIAKGKYHAITYDLTTFAKRRPLERQSKCTVYIDAGFSGVGHTWADAFKELDKAMHPRPEVADLTEAPMSVEA